MRAINFVRRITVSGASETRGYAREQCVVRRPLLGRLARDVPGQVLQDVTPAAAAAEEARSALEADRSEVIEVGHDRDGDVAAWSVSV